MEEMLVQIYVKQENIKAFEEAAEDHFFTMPTAHEHEGGKIYDCNRMTARALRDAIEVMEVEEVPCKFFCSDSNDPSVENFTTEIKKLDGMVLTKKLTNSEERQIALITEILGKIKSGESVEQLQAHLEAKIKMMI